MPTRLFRCKTSFHTHASWTKPYLKHLRRLSQQNSKRCIDLVLYSRNSSGLLCFKSAKLELHNTWFYMIFYRPDWLSFFDAIFLNATFKLFQFFMVKFHGGVVRSSLLFFGLMKNLSISFDSFLKSWTNFENSAMFRIQEIDRFSDMNFIHLTRSANG